MAESPPETQAVTTAPSRAQAIPWDILILSASFAFIFMGAGAQQQFLVPYFSAHGVWSPVVVGLIPASVYISMTVWRVPALWIVARIGERRAMLVGGAAYVAFPAAIYLLSSYPLLVISAATWGLGATLMWVTSSIRILDAASRRSYGRASGFFFGCVHCGILVGMLVLSWIAGTWSLREVFLAASGISLVGWVLMTTLPARHVERRRPDMATVVSMTRTPGWRVVAALLGLSSVGYGLMLGPLGQNIVEELGVSSLALAAVYPTARLIVSISGGWLSDAIGRRGVIVGGFFLAGAGLALTALAKGSPFALAAGIFAIGLLGGVAPAMGLAFVGDTAGGESRLMLHSTLFTVNDAGVAAAILTGQFLRSAMGGSGSTFGFFAVVLTLCGVWSLLTFRPKRA